jgi:hypothetical protein
MIDEKLHGHRLKFDAYTMDQLPIVVMLLASTRTEASVFLGIVPTKKFWLEIYQRLLFLLSHIAQQKVEPPTSSCLLKVPLNLLDQVPNK